MELPSWTFDRAEDYRAHTDFLSYSTAKLAIERSLGHLKAAETMPREETPAMFLGSAIHTCGLEPEEFAARYAISPKFDRRTKDGKAQAEAFQATVTGKIVISEDDAAIAQGAGQSVREHPIAAELLAGAKVESSIYWQDEETGVLCKARPDAYNPESGILIDLKSTQDAGPKFARSDVWGMGYHRQLAYYRLGIEALGFQVHRAVIIAVEKGPPFAVSVYELDDAALRLGLHQIREFLPKYAIAKKADLWPTYRAEIITVSPPAWAFE